jgi:hypothetical protein
MIRLSDVQNLVAEVTRHDNLGYRVIQWTNLVCAEIAARFVGTNHEQVGTLYLSMPWNATSLQMATAGQETWLGAYRFGQTQLGTTGGGVSTYTLTTSSAISQLTQDMMVLNMIYHGYGSTATGTGFMVTNTGTVGRYRQKYTPRTPLDVANEQHEDACTRTVASNDSLNSILYACVGAVFSNGTNATEASSYCRKYDIFPHPGNQAGLLFQYQAPPEKFTTADTAKTNVYLMKFPNLVINGVLRYAMLFLGSSEGYLAARRTYENELQRLALAFKPQVQLSWPRGQAEPALL